MISTLTDERQGRVLWEPWDASLPNQSKCFRRDSLNTHRVPGPVWDAGVTEVPATLTHVLGTLGAHEGLKGDISTQ